MHWLWRGGGDRLSEDITAKTPDIPITDPVSQKLRSRHWNIQRLNLSARQECNLQVTFVNVMLIKYFCSNNIIWALVLPLKLGFEVPTQNTPCRGLWDFDIFPPLGQDLHHR